MFFRVPYKVYIEGGQRPVGQDTLTGPLDVYWGSEEESGPVVSLVVHVTPLEIRFGEVDVRLLVPPGPPALFREVIPECE